MLQPNCINREVSDQNQIPQDKFRHLALGGTFDHLHRGHQQFLRYALSLSSRLTIGLTGDSFSKGLHSGTNLLPYSERKKELVKYLSAIGQGKKIAIVKLIDKYGPTLDKEKTFDSLLVTENTLSGAREINRKRKFLGLSHLNVKVYSLLTAEDGLPISSSRIRSGLIDRQGISYYQRLLDQVPSFLPPEHRFIFQKPFGKVFPGTSRHFPSVMQKVINYTKRHQIKTTICVGDVVTSLFVALDGWPQLSLVDLHVQRQRRYTEICELGNVSNLSLYRLDNPAGSLTVRLVRSIYQALTGGKSSLIRINGEEDLAVLPSILLAPLDSVVIYGHFRHGVILSEVTEAKKRQALKLLNLLRNKK